MTARPSVLQLALYFLKLGATGFGGPLALANYMRRDLVETHHWLSEDEYEEGLAIATACPGPLAYQLAVYCGLITNGMRGALAVAVAFALPPFLIVLCVAVVYERFSSDWQLRALLYGIAPVIVAIILRASWNLATKTLKQSSLAWLVAILACGATIIVKRELAAIFIIAGVAGIFLFAPAREKRVPAASTDVGLRSDVVAGLMTLWFGIRINLPGQLFLFFFKSGLLVFGSGLVIVSFLKVYVVDQYHWLNNQAFLDSVAIGMVSPGPVVISATFVGYVVAGFAGALAATIGIFMPSILFTIAGMPLLRRYRHNPRVGGFVRGITVAVVGALAGTTYIVARTAIGDTMTVVIALVAFAIPLAYKKVPDQLLVGAGALVGLIAYPLLKPAWMFH